MNKLKKELPKLLVVDDREVERNILVKLLSRFNVQIHTASSGEEALSKLIRDEYILILLDIQMPTMDGIETAQLMRSNKRTENVPIMFMTAYDKDEINMMEGYKVGAIDYLYKPINEGILLSKVSTFLRAYSFEKEKEYEKILTELERKNEKLQVAQSEAIRMMEEANKARIASEESQKQIEEQATKLRQTNKELEQFAYVATHDLRAPIINLNGLLKIFNKRGYINDDNRMIVDKIYLSVERINTTLKDLINVVAYTKTVQGNITEVYFENIANDLENDLERQIKQSEADVQFNFTAAPKINFVPGYLRSILQNLLTNAIKYSHPERKPKIDVSTEPSNQYICLKVKDNGIGIAEDQQEKVFGLFQRLTTTVKGKGMGLYIVKSQTEALGGHITYESTPGKGTTFYVYLKDSPKNATDNETK